MERYDVFVGNLTFNTTEEQLRDYFSQIGVIKSVRISVDRETNRPKGFAFVEFANTESALKAIEKLDQTEFNTRKIKVGYPNQSNLRELARIKNGNAPESSADITYQTRSQQQLQKVINGLKLNEAWDMLDAMKKLICDDRQGGDNIKKILERHPQLIMAMYEIQKRLGIVLPPHILQQNQTTSHNMMNPNLNNKSMSELQATGGLPTTASTLYPTNMPAQGYPTGFEASYEYEMNAGGQYPGGYPTEYDQNMYGMNANDPYASYPPSGNYDHYDPNLYNYPPQTTASSYNDSSNGMDNNRGGGGRNRKKSRFGGSVLTEEIDPMYYQNQTQPTNDAMYDYIPPEYNNNMPMDYPPMNESMPRDYYYPPTGGNEHPHYRK